MNWIFTTLRDKGIEFLLLGVAVWWLQTENVAIRKEIGQCQQEKIELFRQENDALRKVIMECTEAIQEIKSSFDDEKQKRRPDSRRNTVVSDFVPKG